MGVNKNYQFTQMNLKNYGNKLYNSYIKIHQNNLISGIVAINIFRGVNK